MALRKLAGDTIWYGASSILTRMISYFMVPLYTAVFKTAEYGIVTDLYAYLAFFYVLYTYGMETAYFRFCTNGNDPRQTYNLSLTSLITTSLTISGALIVFSTPITDLLGYPGQERVIYYLAGILAIDAIISIPYAKIRYENKAKKFAIVKLVQISSMILLNSLFLLVIYPIAKGEYFPELTPMVSWFDKDFAVQYVFLSNFISNLIVILLLYKEFRSFRFTFSIAQLYPMLVYAFPLLFMGLAGITNEMLSRIFLKYWLPDGFYEGLTSIEALGIFGACYKLSVFMQLGIQAFRYAAEPFFFSTAKEKQSPQLFSKVMTAFVQFNAIVLLAVSINLGWIGEIFLLGEDYQSGLNIVPFLLVGYLFSGVYYNLSVWYKVSDKTHYGAIITTIGAFITIVLNYFLIPLYGYFGSSIATVATFFSMAAISYVLGQKHFPVPYQLGRIFEAILVASLLVYINHLITIDLIWLSVLARNLILIIFVFYLYMRERKNLRGRKILGIQLP